MRTTMTRRIQTITMRRRPPSTVDSMTILFSVCAPLFFTLPRGMWFPPFLTVVCASTVPNGILLLSVVVGTIVVVGTFVVAGVVVVGLVVGVVVVGGLVVVGVVVTTGVVVILCVVVLAVVGGVVVVTCGVLVVVALCVVGMLVVVVVAGYGVDSCSLLSLSMYEDSSNSLGTQSSVVVTMVVVVIVVVGAVVVIPANETEQKIKIMLAQPILRGGMMQRGRGGGLPPEDNFRYFSFKTNKQNYSGNNNHIFGQHVTIAKGNQL